jgi:hypothetical protein
MCWSVQTSSPFQRACVHRTQGAVVIQSLKFDMFEQMSTATRATRRNLRLCKELSEGKLWREEPSFLSPFRLSSTLASRGLALVWFP